MNRPRPLKMYDTNLYGIYFFVVTVGNCRHGGSLKINRHANLKELNFTGNHIHLMCYVGTSKPYTCFCKLMFHKF